MPGNTLAIQQEDRFVPAKAPEPKADGSDISSAKKAMASTLLGGILGYVNFDGGAADNTTSQAVAAADRAQGGITGSDQPRRSR